MTRILGAISITAGIAFAMLISEPIVGTWTGDGAYAQRGGSCYISCRNKKWGSQKCQRHCRGRS
jgi:hypothetical protein